MLFEMERICATILRIINTIIDEKDLFSNGVD